MRFEKKRIPIAQKLIIMMAIIMVMVNGVLAYIIQGVMRTSLTETEHKYLAEIVENIGNTSTLTVMEYVAICEVLALNDAFIEVLRESDQDNPMNLHPSAPIVAGEMKSIMEKFGGNIMSMAIFDMETDGFLLNTGEISGEDFSFRERPYYNAVLTGNFVITEPYLDVLTDGLVVTIGCPVVDGGEMLGVVGLDLPIDFLSHLVVESSYGDTGRTVVLDHNHVILAYADPSYINETFDIYGINSPELMSEFEQPTGNLVNYVYTGRMVGRKTVRVAVGSCERRKAHEHEIIYCDNAHEPIVSKTDWNKIQQLFTPSQQSNVRKGEKSPLLGLLKCGHCLHNLDYTKKVKVPYFIGHTSYKVEDCSCKGNRIIESEILEELLREIRSRNFENDDKSKSENKNEATHKILEKRKEQIQLQLKQLDFKKSVLFEKLADEKVSVATFSKESEKLNHERLNLEKEQEELFLKLGTCQLEVAVTTDLPSELRSMISHVLVYHDKNHEIVWK